MPDKVTPGTNLIISATALNDALDAGREYAERERLGTAELPPLSLRTPTDVIRARNDTGGDLPLGSVVELGARILSDTAFDARHLWLPALTPDGTRHFGIYRRPVPDGRIDACQLSGVCLARVDVSDTAHRFAAVDSGSAVLVSAASGPVAIIEPLTATGIQLLAVQLSVAQPTAGPKAWTASLPTLQLQLDSNSTWKDVVNYSTIAGTASGFTFDNSTGEATFTAAGDYLIGYGGNGITPTVSGASDLSGRLDLAFDTGSGYAAHNRNVSWQFTVGTQSSLPHWHYRQQVVPVGAGTKMKLRGIRTGFSTLTLQVGQSILNIMPVN